MIEVFKHYAKCNGLINAAMLKAIEGAKENVYDAKVDGYFKSIGEILEHIYRADLVWLSSFKSVRDFPFLKDAVFAELPKGSERIFVELGPFIAARTHLDAVFAQLADEIEESDLSRNVVRVTRLGEKQEKLFWKALIHVFNHQTHHRGQISQILDQLKVENDYSNMIRID